MIVWLGAVGLLTGDFGWVWLCLFGLKFTLAFWVVWWFCCRLDGWFTLFVCCGWDLLRLAFLVWFWLGLLCFSDLVFLICGCLGCGYWFIVEFDIYVVCCFWSRLGCLGVIVKFGGLSFLMICFWLEWVFWNLVISVLCLTFLSGCLCLFCVFLSLVFEWDCVFDLDFDGLVAMCQNSGEFWRFSSSFSYCDFEILVVFVVLFWFCLFRFIVGWRCEFGGL